MERTVISAYRLHATSIAIALLAASATTLVQAAPRKGTPAQAPADGAAAPDDAAVPTSRSRGTPVTLNFVNADIEAVSRAIGAMLNRDILVDPRVKGNITVYNDKPVESGGFLKVVPEADAKLQTSTVSVGAPQQRGDVVLTQIFRLNYENPNNLVAVLRPLITANNTINASPGNNSLVITDYADNLQRLGKIISALDQPAGGEMQVVQLKNAVASDIVQTVQKLLDSSNSTVPGVPGQSTAASVIVEPRSNSLIVRASNQSRMASALAIIDKLDQPVAGGGPAGNIWVVYLKNADAVKVAELLRAAVSAGGGNGGSGGSPTGGTGGSSTSDGRTSLTQNPNAPSGTSGTAGGASAQSTTPVAASARPSTGGQVQADPATNSLIITASEPVYRQMRSVIDQLDVRRAQVYVESMMVSVDATKAAQAGIQWQGLFGAGNSYIGGGTNYTSSNGAGNIINLAVAGGQLSSGTTGSTSSSSTSVPSANVSGGLNIGFVPKINGIYTLAALANFLETNAGGNVLATPNIVALDNEEAKIVIGQNIPLTTGSYTNTGGSSSTVNPFQTVERQDIGITLRIRSQIGENGTIRMTVYEENSARDANFATNQITTKTSVETFITVDDGAMVVLGGLTRDEYGDTSDGVPLLSSIPVIGNLFKSSTRTRHKQTLMLFLRPIVMRDQSDVNKLTVDRYNAIRAQQQSFQPDTSWVMRINDTPVVPPVKPDTQIDPSVPHNPETESVKLPTITPVPDMRRVPAAPVAPLIPVKPATNPAPGETRPAAPPAPASAPSQGQ
ncbi:MAG: type II secretion system secretin GspD [Burkholderiales bacterium]|nr:type II secretion system secretin GspD [Burkholderiales bacterium]